MHSHYATPSSGSPHVSRVRLLLIIYDPRRQSSPLKFNIYKVYIRKCTVFLISSFCKSDVIKIRGRNNLSTRRNRIVDSRLNTFQDDEWSTRKFIDRGKWNRVFIKPITQPLMRNYTMLPGDRVFTLFSRYSSKWAKCWVSLRQCDVRKRKIDELFRIFFRTIVLKIPRFSPSLSKLNQLHEFKL